MASTEPIKIEPVIALQIALLVVLGRQADTYWAEKDNDPAIVSFGFVDRKGNLTMRLLKVHAKMAMSHLVELLSTENSPSEADVDDAQVVLTTTTDNINLLLSEKLAKFPVHLNAAAWESEFKIRVSHMSDSDSAQQNLTRFSERLHTALDFLSRFDTLHELESVLVNDVPILGHNEKTWLLEEWSGANRETSQQGSPLPFPCIQNYFEEAARKYPNRIAVQFMDEDFLTYAELNKRAEGLASYLVKRGVEVGEVLPLFFAKSVEMIVAMLGTLKARAAYSPLDPAHPAGRTRTIAESLKARFVLTTTSLVEDVRVRLHEGTQYILVDQLPSCGDTSIITSRPDGEPDDLCYVLFTSGSTGTPKGVMVPQRAVVASVVDGPDSNTRLLQSTGLRTLLFSNYAFDYTVWDIYLTLSAGGCLVVAPQQYMMDDLTGTINKFNINFLETTPTVIALLQPEHVPGLKTLYSGGEPLAKAVRDQWSERVILGNVYGPTETTVCCTFCIVDANSDPSVIGRPFGQNVAYVLSKSLSPVPVNVAGELYISGAQVSHGYLSRPDLTESSYKPDPFRPGHTIYATGDLVRWTEAGHLKCLGRVDSQCKIRGQRIEISEIEAVMATHTEISRVCVLKRTHASGHEDLIAFYEPRSMRVDVESQLVQLVKEQLPRYMIPAALFSLEQLPLTSSGKVDRRHLETLINDMSTHAESKGILQPTTNIEHMLHAAWSETLSIPSDSIGIDQDFFELGGDSISAIKLSSAIRRAGYVLNASDIGMVSTIQEQARRLDGAKLDARGSEYTPFSLIPNENVGREIAESLGIPFSSVEDILPATKTMTGLIALSSQNPQSYFVQYVFEKRGLFDAKKLGQAWEYAIGAIPILRAVFCIPHINGVSDALQIVLRGNTARAPILHEYFETNAGRDNAVKRYLEVDKARGFRVGQIPTRIAIFESAEVLNCIWSIHHAQYDGWSFPLIIKTVEDAYEQLMRTDPLIMSRTNLTPFSHYIEWAHNQDWQAGCAYWQKELEDVSVLAWPKVPNDIGNVASDQLVSHTWDADGLGEYCVKHRVTASSVVRAALAITLGIRGDTTDVLYGVVSSGRSATIDGVENIVGPCISTTPFRVVLVPDQPVNDLIKVINQKSLESTRYDYLGLSDIIKQTSVAGSSSDLFQVLLTFQNLPDLDIEGDSVLGKNISGHVMEMNYALGVTVFPSKHGLQFDLEPDSRCVREQDLHWFKEHLFATLNAIVRNVSERMMTKSLPPMTDTESRFLTEIGKGITPDPYWEQQSFICDLFDRQALIRPEAVAIDYAGLEQITYGDMMRKTNQAAHGLQQLGVQPETIVPILFDKNTNQIDAVLTIVAVLKAGGAFVPLDASWPAERLRSCMEQSKATFYVHGSSPPPVTAELHMRSLTLADLIAGSPTTRPPTPSLTRDNLAYVIFTSGSTGKPKGVMIEHRNIVAYVANGRTVYPLSTTKRILHFSPFSFDQGLGDIYCSLSHGITLVLADMDAILGNMTKVIEDLRVDYTVLTPAVAQLLDETKVLKSLLVGGEKLVGGLIDKWKGKVFFMDDYGPTECTVSCCGMVFQADTSVPAGVIGRSFGNTRAYIVDSCMALVHVGEIGELCIAGDQVGRGYLDLPEVSAKSFVNDPFHPGSRLYRTGDRARWTSEGYIEYLGREQDGQVKLRGLRIDTGEIEAALCTVPDTFAAVELLELDGKPHLVAFVSHNVAANANETVATLNKPSDEVQSWGQQLVSSCEVSIPVYARPTLWIPIHTMPQNNNNKVDRKKLRAFYGTLSEKTVQDLTLQVNASSTQGMSYVPPATPLEREIQQLWVDILGTKEISVCSSFFSVGGDSISVVQLVAGLKRLGVDITIREIYQFHSIRALAEFAGDADATLLEEVSSIDSAHSAADQKEAGRSPQAQIPPRKDSQSRKTSVFKKIKSAFKGMVYSCFPIRSHSGMVRPEASRAKCAISQPLKPTKTGNPSTTTSPVISVLQRTPEPLYLVHDGSGFCTSYTQLPNLSRPVYTLTSPCHADTELRASFPTFTAYAEHYTHALVKHIQSTESSNKQGIFLGGWSFGGMIALELGMRLYASGHKVSGVVMIDSFDVTGWEHISSPTAHTPETTAKASAAQVASDTHQQHVSARIVPTYVAPTSAPFPILLVRAEKGLESEGSAFKTPSRTPQRLETNFWKLPMTVETIQHAGHMEIMMEERFGNQVAASIKEWCEHVVNRI